MLVNPKHGTVFGERAHRSPADAPPVDLAVVMVARERVEAAVREALEAGAGGLLVVTGGFRESGDAVWAAAEGRIASACRAAGVPLLGPNCIGLVAMPARAVISIGPYPWGLQSGGVALPHAEWRPADGGLPPP